MSFQLQRQEIDRLRVNGVLTTSQAEGPRPDVSFTTNTASPVEATLPTVEVRPPDARVAADLPGSATTPTVEVITPGRSPLLPHVNALGVLRSKWFLGAALVVGGIAAWRAIRR